MEEEEKDMEEEKEDMEEENDMEEGGVEKEKKQKRN